jgi:hypothetical protein
METIICTCGAKITRPIGTVSLCGCGKAVAATGTSDKHSGEKPARKVLEIAPTKKSRPRPLLPLKDEPPAEKR